jgi:hypothetical protein
MTYLLTNGAVGVRISMIAAHEMVTRTPPHCSPRGTSIEPNVEPEQMSFVSESVADRRL